ncbi:class I glutamine amidotransferase-like protein [Hypoxylon sp. NC1633]|nr:class I glutamine amidotransferase-like protein [Hypoxylon sp. NC1633]
MSCNFTYRCHILYREPSLQPVIPPVSLVASDYFHVIIKLSISPFQPAQPPQVTTCHRSQSFSADTAMPTQLPTSAPQSPPARFAAVLFPGFQALDVFGPLDILNLLSKRTPLTLSLLASTLDSVSTNTIISPSANPSAKSGGSSSNAISQSVLPTQTFAAAAADDVEVLLVPGGFGTRDPANVGPAVDFVRAAFPRLRYLLTVCTGSAAAAMAGVLDGRRATTNKRAWEWATAQGPKVNWVRQARWVTDGNVWTSSGISAGIDMMYAFVADQYGEDVARELADAAEYVRNTDPDADPFAVKAEAGVPR